MEIVFLIVGLLLGATVAYFFVKNKPDTAQKEFQIRMADLEKQISVLTDRNQQMVQSNKNLEELQMKEREKIITLSAQLAAKEEIVNNFQDKLENQKSEVENLQKKFTAEFENLSSRIFEEKSKKFVEQNRTNLDIILNPLREKIKDFEQKVENSYKIESAERHTLKGEIRNLIELNKQISDEANNLARALKGDAKKQGNWGEVILERILERSGLIKGSEYEVQFSTTNEDGRRIQPDIVINLPDNKHIVIDSKVSLVAYESMVNALTDEDREKSLRDHILSVRSHIKGLSDKNYQSSAGINTPDFVLLFMPIESSFGMAVQADNELFTFAWDRKIVIVSPSTLLATMKTISSIWKQERQTRNAIEIARQGGALYDKFKNFVDDLIDVGNKMNGAKKSYEDAMTKLSSGSGNLVKRVEDLKKLGAKSTKDLPLAILEKAQESMGEE